MLTTIEKLKSASGDLVKVILQNAKSFISFDEGIRSQISNMELVWSHLTVTGEREAVEDVKKSLHARHDVLTDEKLPSRRHPELAFNEIREQMDFDIDRNYRSQSKIWTDLDYELDVCDKLKCWGCITQPLGTRSRSRETSVPGQLLVEWSFATIGRPSLPIRSMMGKPWFKRRKRWKGFLGIETFQRARCIWITSSEPFTDFEDVSRDALQDLEELIIKMATAPKFTSSDWRSPGQYAPGSAKKGLMKRLFE